MLEAFFYTVRALSQILATMTELMQRATAVRMMPKHMVGINDLQSVTYAFLSNVPFLHAMCM